MSDGRSEYIVTWREYLPPHRGRQPRIQIWGDGAITIHEDDQDDAHGIILTAEQMEKLMATYNERKPAAKPTLYDVEVPL